MSEPLFWTGSFEGKPRKSHGLPLALAGLAVGAVSLTLAVMLPPRASPLDLGAYWSAWAAQTAWQGALAVTVAWAALAIGPMRTSPAKEKLLAWLGLALVWTVAAMPPPMLARQTLHDAQLSSREIAARYRADAVRAKND